MVGLYELIELVDSMVISDSNKPLLVRSKALSPVWEMPSYVGQLNRVCKKGTAAMSIAPESLVMMVACCHGYSFNHTNTRISDHKAIQSAWGKLDTVLTKLSTNDTVAYRDLLSVMESRTSMGFSVKMGVVHSSIASDATNRGNDQVFYEVLPHEVAMVDDEFPGVFEKPVHVILAAKAKVRVSRLLEQ